MHIKAVDYVNNLDIAPGGTTPDTLRYGSDVILNAPPYNDRPNMAEWRVSVPADGQYRFEVQYAAKDVRPIRVFINGELWRPIALDQVTGCWEPQCQKWISLGIVNLNEGNNTVRFDRDHFFPHIRELLFTPVD